ncbi:MAG: Hsp20/alpha crystallin family protein [Nitrosomonas sp.]|nr:Hsp20/alpha crystallin family protein [Nitrosomonas sp.]MDP1951071.1 Hsp20/alpha crystallin family protein [Nitrosomonas sp.]
MRRPVPDIFDEPDFILVTVEVDGLTRADIQLELHEDILTFTAERGDVKFSSEILLPGVFSADKMSYTCHNGVLGIKIAKS